MNPEYFQARQEKLLSTALSLEQPNLRKQSPSSKQSVPETVSPREGVRERSRELSPPAPEPAGGQASGSRPVGKWSSKDLYLAVSTVQVTGNPKGTSVGKEAAPSQVRPREPMSVLMMANREVVNTELGSYHDSAENEDCSQPMDDIQVSAGEASPPRLGRPAPPPWPSHSMSRGRVAAFPAAFWKAGLPCQDAERRLCPGNWLWE